MGGKPGHVGRILEQGEEVLARVKKHRMSRWIKQSGLYPGPHDRDIETGPSVIPPSKLIPSEDMAKNIEDFMGIIRARDLQLHFQPIVFLESGGVFGYEALLRGPSDTYFQSPIILFSMARKLDMELELDLICFNRLKKLAPDIPEDMKIFFNVSPESFFNPKFIEVCERSVGDIRPERLVFEVIRKRRIREFPRFRESVLDFKKKGYQVAVDDARAGTLSLRAILELSPDYVKSDMSITRDIYREPDKQHLFQQFNAFCRRQDVRLIMEGVESEQEKHYLLENGAILGQGFLFSRPLPIAA
jgi:EAL domain-containing protein (putative c-di-GMP-specific phosphodiesterase class I)